MADGETPSGRLLVGDGVGDAVTVLVGEALDVGVLAAVPVSVPLPVPDGVPVRVGVTLTLAEDESDIGGVGAAVPDGDRPAESVVVGVPEREGVADDVDVAEALPVDEPVGEPVGVPVLVLEAV